MTESAPKTANDGFTRIRNAITDPNVRELFTPRFLAASESFARLVDAASHRILDGIGALPSSEGVTVPEIKNALSIPWRRTIPLTFMYEQLVGSGVLYRAGDRYVADAVPGEDFDSVADELLGIDPGTAPAVEIVRTLVEESPRFFRGEATGDEILFRPAQLRLWQRYFSNENPLYAINNAVGTQALSRVASSPNTSVEILEIGGGCGSAAEAVLTAFGPAVTRYRFTEVAETFARYGERVARAAADPSTLVESARVDMTKPWAEQGVEPASFDVVYSVNCFHVAPDLDFVLAEAVRALKPGGALVVSECMRPTQRRTPVYTEFIFTFLDSFVDVATDPVKRPTHGFLTPSAWRASLAAAGLSDIEVLPDVDIVAQEYADFVVGAMLAYRP